MSVLKRKSKRRNIVINLTINYPEMKSTTNLDEMAQQVADRLVGIIHDASTELNSKL